MNRKLTPQDVVDARRRYREGVVGIYTLAREYGVHKKTLRGAIDGTTWKNVPYPVNNRDAFRKSTPRMSGEHNGNAHLSAQQVVEVRQKYARGGITQQALACRFGVVKQTVANIIKGATWRDVDPR